MSDPVKIPPSPSAFRAAWTSFKESGSRTWTRFLRSTQVDAILEQKNPKQESLKPKATNSELPPKVLVCRSHIFGVGGPLCQSLSRKHIGEVHQRQANKLNVNWYFVEEAWNLAAYQLKRKEQYIWRGCICMPTACSLDRSASPHVKTHARGVHCEGVACGGNPVPRT